MSDSQGALSENNSLKDLSSADVALLRCRASRYAELQNDDESDQFEVVIFRRGPSHYALPLQSLREIRPARQVSQIPGSSVNLAGIFHYRGEILGLYDLHGYVRNERASFISAWTLLIEHEGERLGLAADEVLGVDSIAAEKVHPMPVTFGEQGACFLGVLETGTLLLNGPRLFSTPTFFAAF